MRKDEEKERRQLRWECIRLNPEYRELYDSCQIVDENDDDVGYDIDAYHAEKKLLDLMDWSANLNPPDYRIENLIEALKKSNPKLTDQEINNFFTRDIGKASTIEVHLPLCLEDCKHEYLDGGEWDSIIEVSFTEKASKKEVQATIERIFDRIQKRKALKKEGHRKIKITLLREALQVYKNAKYGKVTIREIALKAKTQHETYAGAYNRIKKQYRSAINYVEKSGFKHI